VAEKYRVSLSTEKQISLMGKMEQPVTARLIIITTIKIKINICVSGEKYRSGHIPLLLRLLLIFCHRSAKLEKVMFHCWISLNQSSCKFFCF